MHYLKNRTTHNQRRKELREYLESGKMLRLMEAHNGISALVANDTEIEINGKNEGFHAIWGSSLTDSASKGYPDADIIGFESRSENLRQILEASHKPVIFDGDTGGEASNFEYMVRKLEDMGVSGVIIEDKVYPKRNSLSEGASQSQEDPDVFATKVSRGKSILFNEDFLIIARIESLISGAGIEDAVKRARKYLLAGADGILIHSKNRNPDEIIEFSRRYGELCKELGFRKPLFCVPTTYNTITEKELKESGFDAVIYANHLLRSSFNAMKETAKLILANQRSLEADSLCCPVSEIFDKVGFSDVKSRDMKFAKGKVSVIIPAAGRDSEFQGIPKAMLDIKGKPLLQRQVDMLKKNGIKDISVIRGYEKEKFSVQGIKYTDNDDYEKTFILDSLFRAEESMNSGFIYINSDLLFKEDIIKRLLETKDDIVLVVDNSYEYHKHNVDKGLDLVMAKQKPSKSIRVWEERENEVVRIGKNISKEMADFEFIGIAYFSEYGADILKKVYHDCLANSKGNFHEAPDLKRAGFTDIIQEIIDRGFKVKLIEVHKGWMEIHNRKDFEEANKTAI